MQQKSTDELRELIVNSSSLTERRFALAELENRLAKAAEHAEHAARYRQFQQERARLQREFHTCSAQHRGNLTFA